MGLLADGHFARWFVLFAQNIAMGMAVVAIFSTFRAATEDTRKKLNTAIVGVLFGISAIASMMFPVQIRDGMSVDLRVVSVLIGGLFGGWPGAVIATGMAAAFRLYLGGVGASGGIAAILATGVVGYLFAWLSRRRRAEIGLVWLLAAGLAAALVSIAAVRIAFLFMGVLALPYDADLALLILSPVASAVIGTSLSLMHPKLWRRTEALLTDIVETTTDLVWAFDAEGVFTYVSDRYVDVLGMGTGEIIGKTVADLGWRAADQSSEQSYRTALAGHLPFRGLLFTQQRKSGEKRLIAVTGRPAFDAKGRFSGYRGVASDVTEIERWRTLAASIAAKVGDVVGEDFLRILAKTLADVLGARSAYIGRLDVASGTLRDILYYSRGAFFNPPEASVQNLPGAVVIGGKPLIVRSGVRLLYPELNKFDSFDDVEAYGGVPLMNSRGEVLGILAVIDDHPWDSPEYIETTLGLFAGRATAEIERVIRDREREEARRQMADTLAALELARGGIIVHDTDWRILYANRAAIELRGLTIEPAAIVGTFFRDYQRENPDYVKVSDQARAAFVTGDHWEGIMPWRRPNDERLIFIESRLQRLPNGGVVAVIFDATERVRLEREERLHRERDAQLDKVEALGKLAAGIAHDFNNLLGAVLGFGQFLMQDLPPQSEQRGYAERIVTAGMRGQDLARQILSFSRSVPIERTSLLLGPLVAETAAMLRGILPATTLLAVEGSLEGAAVRANKGQIVQLLVNLCVNASDALEDEPGTVTVSIAPPDLTRKDFARLPAAVARPTPEGFDVWSEPDGTGHIVGGIRPERDSIVLAVSDTGSGIPGQMLGTILEPFVTTKGEGKGTGLGLAVVRRIVAELGGALVVTSREGKGTRFEIVLPQNREQDDAGVPIAANHGPSAHAPGHVSVLIVDDDEAHRAMLEVAMRRLGYLVEGSGDPRGAIRRITDGTHHWDVLITDRAMPYLRGDNLVRTVKKIRPEMICIICSGSTGPDRDRDAIERQAMEAGADGFLLKPCNVEDLADMLARLLGQRPNLARAASLR